MASKPVESSSVLSVVVVGDTPSIGGLCAALDTEGLRVVRRASVGVYCDALGDEPDHCAVIFVTDGELAHEVMQRLSTRWGARRPLVLVAGPMLTALDVDGLVERPKDGNSIRSAANMIRRVGLQQSELTRLRNYESSIRHSVQHDLRVPLVALSEISQSLSGEMLSASARMDVQGLIQTITACQRRLDAIRPTSTAPIEQPEPVATSLRGLVADAVSATGYANNVVEWCPRGPTPS